MAEQRPSSKCKSCGFESDAVIICDNDCGTVFCSKCNDEWYYVGMGNYLKGHNPHCGDSSSE